MLYEIYNEKVSKDLRDMLINEWNALTRTFTPAQNEIISKILLEVLKEEDGIPYRFWSPRNIQKIKCIDALAIKFQTMNFRALLRPKPRPESSRQFDQEG